MRDYSMLNELPVISVEPTFVDGRLAAVKVYGIPKSTNELTKWTMLYEKNSKYVRLTEDLESHQVVFVDDYKTIIISTEFIIRRDTWQSEYSPSIYIENSEIMDIERERKSIINSKIKSDNLQRALDAI